MSSPNPSTESTMQVIEAQRQGEGALSFTLPVNPADISKIEAVDLDLLLTMADGQQFILPQGALLAMTQPNSAMRFANGEESLASDAIKRVGVLKPVENGSFRLAGLDMESLEPEPVQGTGFGLGQEIQDVVSKLDTSSQRMEQILRTLDQVTQASPVTKGDEPPPSTQTGVKRTTKLADPNPFASPTPGAPPKQDNENISSIKITDTNRGLFGATDNAVPHVRVVDDLKTAALTQTERDQGKEVLKPLIETSVREMLPNGPMQIRVTGTEPVNLEPAGTIHNTLVMPGVLNATSVRFELPAGSKLPPDFKIAGFTFTNGVLTVPAESLKDLQLSVQWKAEPQGTLDGPIEFQMGVKYLNAQGAELDQGRAPINFTYGKLHDLDNLVQLDGNSNTKIFLSAHGYNYSVRGDAQDNTITSGHGHDTLTGGAGNDTLTSGAGDDRLDGGIGVDSMSGGTGNDTYVVDDSGDRVTELDGQGTDTVLSSITYALGTQMEHLELTGSLAINGTGNDLANTLTGNSGNNTLSGGASNDTLVGGDGDDVLNGDADDDVIFGGAGADTIDGGAGSDTASYSGSIAAVIVNLTDNTTSGGHAEGDRLTTIENLIGSSAYGDTLTGNSGVNRIEGGGGNDTLDGGGGSDTLLGGTGDDTYIISNADVTITEFSGQGTDIVRSSVDHTLVADLENLTLTGNALISGTGNGQNNTLIANNSGNTLNGEAGNDTLTGGNGNDHLNGGANDDNLTGGNGDDNLSGGDGDDALIGGNGNDTLNGDAGNDTLRATAGNNTLDGGAGNDTLVAGTGNDTLMGGDGNDTLDLRAHNLSLLDDSADGGVGDDTVIINQSQNTATATATATSTILDGGAGTDTLQVWGTSSATLSLGSLRATNFEILDLRSDTATTQVSLSSASIMQLVNNSGVDVLTLHMGRNDTYTIAANETATVTQGQSVSFYNGTAEPANLIAQVNFEYA
jgi:Ca2+-binding RTX toxin-like protein